MKFLLATVTSSALVATFAAAEPCTIPQLTKIMMNDFTKPCMTGSGLDFMTLNGVPTQAQLTSFCKTSACTSFLKAVMAQNPPDCTLPTGNLQFRSQLFDPIEKFCSAVSSDGAGAGAGSTSAATSNDAGSASLGNDGAGAGAGSASAVTSNDAGSASLGNATTYSNATSHSNTTMPATNNNTMTTKPDTIAADNGSASSAIDSQIEGSEDSMSKANSDTEPATSAATTAPTPSTTAPTPSTTKSAADSSFAVSACASALGVAALLWVL